MASPDDDGWTTGDPSLRLTLGELCAGYGGLGLGIAQVLNCEPAWVADVCKVTKHKDGTYEVGHHEPCRSPLRCVPWREVPSPRSDPAALNVRAGVRVSADERVKFGNETPGGTRISRLSHIDGPKSAPVMLSQGRAGVYKVEPLPELSRADALRAEWKTATPERRAEIEAEMKGEQA